MTCAYCQTERGVNQDHVVPKSLVKKHARDVASTSSWVHEPIPSDFLGTVDCCLTCNVNKGTRRLVPPSWADKVEELNAFFGGTPFRVWSGDTREPAFVETHR